MSERVQAFIDAAVQDQQVARQMLRDIPGLLNARHIHGETVLHFLAVEGFAEGVRFLAETGADVDATNEFGDTPLVDAATLGNATVVAVLLQHGADPNARSATRENVVHAAGGSGCPEVLDMVLNAGGRLDYVTDIGELSGTRSLGSRRDRKRWRRSSGSMERSVFLRTQGPHNIRLQRTALRAAAEPER